MATRNAAAQIAENGVTAPAAILTPERLNEPLAGYDEKNEPTMLAIPLPEKLLIAVQFSCRRFASACAIDTASASASKVVGDRRHQQQTQGVGAIQVRRR